MPGGLETTIIRVMRVNTAEYDLLFSISSWPNVILCLFGGIFIDRILGLRLGLIIVVSTALTGQIVWSLGGFFNNYYIMLAGRFFVGAGNDLTVIISHSFKAIWFKDKLSFAMSIDTAFSRLGGALTLVIPELINNRLLQFVTNSHVRLGIILLISAGELVIALIFTIIVIIMDYIGEENVSRTKTKRFKMIKLTDVKQFSASYWLAVVINTTFFPMIFSFISIAQIFFVQKYNLAISEANIANSLIFGATILAAPVVGLIVDKVGFNMAWVIGGILITLATHIILEISFQFYIPFIASIFFSLSYTLVGPAFSPIPTLLVKPEYTATAYGIFRSNYNLAFSTIALVTGLIVDKKGYLFLEIFYTILTSISLMAAITLSLIDFTLDEPIINIPGSKRQDQRKEKFHLLQNSEDDHIQEEKREDLYSFDKLWNGKKWTKL
jgi:MFS family permease